MTSAICVQICKHIVIDQLLILLLHVAKNLVAHLLDHVIITEKINQQFFILRLKRLNVNAVDIRNLDLVRSYFEALHI